MSVKYTLFRPKYKGRVQSYLFYILDNTDSICFLCCRLLKETPWVLDRAISGYRQREL